MKRPVHLRKMRSCLWGLAGFVLAFSIRSALKSPPATPATAPVGPGAADSKAAGPVKVRREMDAAAAEFAKDGGLSPATALRLAEVAGVLSDAEMETAVESIPRERKDDPRRLILLLRWAQRNPTAVMSWLLKSGSVHWLTGFQDNQIVLACVARNSAAVKTWYAHLQADHKDRETLGYLIAQGLSEMDAVKAAEFCDELNVEGVSSWKVDVYMQSVDDPRPMIELAMAKLAPLNAPKDNGQLMLRKADQRFGGWKNLLQSGTTRWYEHDPDSFGVWLRGQPEEFRNDTEALLKVTTARPDFDKPPPEPAAPPPLTAFRHDDPATVPSQESAPAALEQWAGWWSQDRGAAEAFLRKSAWPEDLKFKARAAAYASIP